MKRLSLFALLGASLVLVGCNNQPEPTPTPSTGMTETTEGEFASAVCNDYFRVLNCVLETQVPE